MPDPQSEFWPELNRLPNGVRRRADGGGDPWANEHRQLGPRYYMEDLDQIVNLGINFINTSDRAFFEYVPDAYKNCNKVIRKFAVVAVFERKASLNAMNLNIPQRAFLFWHCRQLSAGAPCPARFFYVIGTCSPWKFLEYSPQTGERVGEEFETTVETQREVWKTTGLTKAREVLELYTGYHGH